MTRHRASLCLSLVLTLAGCATQGTPSTASPLSTATLCDGTADLVGLDLTVIGPFATDRVSSIGGSVAACEPGTCCNTTYYAPTITCADGQRIEIAVADPVAVIGTEPPAHVCRSLSDDHRPSDACPVDAGCITRLERVTSLSGHLEMRTSRIDGLEHLTLVATASTHIDDGL
jgi:hypothetical protein